MGVKGLWTILDPVGVSCPLSEIAERSVAVDLSGWVVEAETSALSHAVSRPYLRNLAYRTSALLLQHTLPVFVLDGAAPELKRAEMARRQGHQPASTGRQQLRGRLQRCARLLDTLGVPHLTADAEAEALCARLDAAGLVDGVVTDDVDAALYGARTLYRQLSAGRTGGQLTRYSLRQVETELGLDQRQLRELALLLGCDFLPEGLPGVGAQTARELVRRLAGRPLLAELARWLREPELSQMRAAGELGRMASHCAACGHPGTELRHQRSGCPACGDAAGCRRQQGAACACDWHRQRRLTDEHAAELRARDCARRAPDFERDAAAALAELERLEPLPAAAPLVWRRPDPAAFTVEAGRELGWSSEQSWELLAPLLARWQLRYGQPDEVALLRPLAVQRASRHHHVDCYLMSWQSPEGRQLSTHEPRPLLEKAHPQLVDAYLQTKKQKKPASRRPRKTTGDGDNQSRHITDFFPTRKTTARRGVGSKRAANTPPPESAPAPAAGPGGASASASDPAIIAEAGAAAGSAGRDSGRLSAAFGRGNAASPGTASSASPLPLSPLSPLLSGADSDAETDGSVADLSAIIDAITRTHISERAVVVVSDDEGDVWRPVGAVAAATDAGSDSGPRADSGADAGSGSEAEAEYVPLYRRLAQRT